MQLARENHSWIPPLIILYNFCTNLANDIYLPSLPKLVHVFSTNASYCQLTMSAWFAGVALPQLFFGPLTDKFGRRPILFFGAICFLIATLACTFASNIWVLIVSRFFQGVGVCSLNVTTFGILIDLYNYKTRTQIMTKISMCGTLAPLIGPIIGGYMLAYFGWRSNFVLIFVLSSLVVFFLWLKLTESNLFLNPDATVFKNIYKNYFALLKNGVFLQNLVPYCLILGAIVGYLTAAPFIIIHKLKIAPEHFGYTQFPIVGAYILGSLFIAYMSNEDLIKAALKYGIRLVFFSGFLFVLLACFYGSSLVTIIIPMAFYALGFSFCSGSLVNEAMTAAEKNKGSAAAFLGFGMAMSCMLTTILVGLIYNDTLLSIAIILFLNSLLAYSFYFLHPAMRVIDEYQKS